jgi:signal transduction histidine kinase/DNA-binding CsgD family transcriptional regulator
MARADESQAASYSDQLDGQVVLAEFNNSRFPTSSLTPRQREIAGLLARGLPNAEIAQQLVLTRGTVANHVASILQRLELESRTQIAAWAVERGLHGGQDRLLATLERLLEFQPSTLKDVMDHAANLVSEALSAEKVDAFLHDEATATLVAIGTSSTPLGQRQRASGLDRQAIADGGRSVQVFLTGQAHIDGDVQKDEEELMGIRRGLNVRSQMAVPLETGDLRRGVLTAQSTQPDFFAERDLLFLQAVGRWVGSLVQRAELSERNAAAALEQGRRMAAEELVTLIAHDLRNHLAPIRGRLDLLERRAARENYTSIVRDASELRRAVDRLSRLISDLLDIARIDQGPFDVRPEPMDLVALVSEAAEALEVPDTRIEVEAASEMCVVADPVRVRQAVENLLANAVQHAPPGTTVNVRVANEESAPRPTALVVITDHGPGIDPTLLPHLFERFARSSNSHGLGIGLFVARQIAEAHGGGVDVTSSSHNGTQFRLLLPAEPVRPGQA